VNELQPNGTPKTEVAGEFRDDRAIKNAMIAYEVLIVARNVQLAHQKLCQAAPPCVECATHYERYKSVKEAYLKRIFEMIG
jgi:hypothetical protein